jgi:hypothetical protein
MYIMKCKLLFTYAAAFFMAMYGYAQTTVSVGTGAASTTGGTNGTPIYRSSAASIFDYAQSVQLYTQADLNAVGIYSGATISSIGLFKTTAFTMTAGATASLTINMKNSTQAALNTADVFTALTAGAQVVYQNAVDNTVIPASTGFVVFPLSTTFTYTGGSIEIGFDWDASSFAGNPSTGAFGWAFETVPTIQARGTSSDTPITAGLTGTLTRRHQLQVTYTGGAVCTAPPVGGQTVANFPTACDGLPVVLAVTGDALGTGSNTQWQFSVDNTSYADIAGATLPTYNFTYGAASAGYYQRVETCSAQTGTSAPIQITPFVAVINQAEPFGTYLPTCWTEAAGLLVPSVTFTSTTASNWMADGFLNNGASGSARIEIWTTTTAEWLISPTYNLTGNEQLVFDLGLTIWNSAAVAGTTGVDDKFAVIISTDDGATWSDANTLRLWDNAGSTNVYNNISNTGETVILDLSSYSGNVKFGFYGESTVSNADNNVYIDNFRVRTIATCLEPLNLTVSNVTNSTAVLSWTAGATEATWDIEIVAAGTAPTGTPTNAGVSNPFNVTGLTAVTAYNYYVRAACSTTSFSTYAGPFSFTTTASCGDTIYDTGGASGNYSANESYTVTYFPDTAGNVVTLNFTLVDLETCCDDLEVFDGTDVTATAFTTDLIAPESFRATNAAGAITIRFSSDGSVQGAGWVATYTCAAPPSCLEPTALTATTITDTTAQLSWTESNATAATLWDIEIVAAGTAPTGTPTNAGVSNPFNVTGLTAVTAYDYYVRAACSTTSFSTYAGPFSFTTTASCGDTIYDTGGASGNYSANESYTATYFPDTAGNVVTLNFTLVDLENCCDDLEVFDGIDVTATAFTTDLIAPESFRATNAAGAITIRFTSDSSVQGAGWAATYTCAAPPSCLEPTALTATTITDTTAQLSWTESNATAATLWDIEIVAAGTAPTGTPTNAGASNPFNATGLSADTAYDFYVRAACSTTDFSPYSGPVSFRTRCAAVTTFPVTTDFTTNVPNTCWSEAGGGELAAGPSGLGASDWGANRAYTNAAGTVVPSNRLNLYQNVDREWLISETYDLSGGTYNLAVEVAVTNYTFSGTSSPANTDTMGSDDSVILAVSADNGATWSALTTWDVNNQPAVTGTEFFADLSAFTGNVQFAFLGSDGTVSDPEDYDFHIGSFRIETTAGTNDTALAASLSLYPNPVTGDELNITFSQSSQDAVNVTIVNMTGQVLRAQRFDQVAGTVQLNDMARLASGVYFVNVTQGAQVATLKFIKQ